MAIDRTEDEVPQMEPPIPAKATASSSTIVADSRPKIGDPGPSSSNAARPRTGTRRSTLDGREGLQRTNTTGSIHAQTSLRRMMTHETGTGYIDPNATPDDLDDHDEEDEAEVTSGNRGSVSSHSTKDSRGTEPDNELHDEEKEIEGSNTPVKRDRRKDAEAQLQDQTNLLPVKQVIFVFIGLTCALFCSLLDQTIVTTALPTIGQVFNRSDIAPWIGTSYLLTSTLMQPIYGRVSDIFGRKIVLLFSQVTFLIGALASSQAQSMIQLIVFRAIQGIGGGGILNLSMIIISDVVSLKDRGKYQGISGCVMAAAMSAGPIIGGVFTESIGWRWCFYITLPISGVSIIIVIFLLPLKRVKGGILKKLRMLDWWGSVLTIAWSILVLLAFSFAGSTYGWKSPAVIAPLVIGIMLLGVWLYVEARVVALPLVPLRIFRIMTVSAMMTTTLFSGMVFYATLYYLPTYYQVVRGESAIRSGVLLLPLVTVQTVTSFVTGFVQSKTGDYWWALTIGFAMWSIGLGLLSTINETTPTAHLIGFQIIDGIGAGQTFQTSLVAIQAAVERKDMAVATGMRNFMRMLGGTLALTICSTIINNLVRGRLSSAGLDADLVNRVVADPTAAVRDAIDTASRLQVTHAYAYGIRACFWFMIPFAVLSFILTVFFTKKIPLKRADDAERKAEAKAWVEAKKVKHAQKRKGSDHSAETAVEELPNGHGIKEDLEEAGRGVEEALGGQPAQKEGKEQGPIGSS